MNAVVPADGSASQDWVEEAVASGDAGVPRSSQDSARSRIFDDVRADRNGPTGRRLLDLATDSRPPVRQTALRLLTDLSWSSGGWDEAAAVADRCLDDLDDRDARVRRAAAGLLAAAGDVDRITAVLRRTLDATVRVALVEATDLASLVHRDDDRWRSVVRGMTSDPLPAVRVVANTARLGRAGPADWSTLDAVIRADVEGAAGRLGAPGSGSSWTAGQRWARAMVRLDREHDCGDWAERMTRSHEPAAARLAGVDLAVAAMRTWRAAPARLTPALVEIVTERPSDVRTAAVQALGASLTATRLAADRLAPLLDDPELGATVAAALGSVGDHQVLPQLLQHLRGGDVVPRLGEALDALLRAGVDPGELVRTARARLDEHPEDAEQDTAAMVSILGAVGPAAAEAVPALVARMAALSQGAAVLPRAEIAALERIGPAAGAAVPLLQEYAQGGGDLVGVATRALLTITQDRSVADRYLAALPAELRRSGVAPRLMAWLLDHGGLTPRQDRQLRHLLLRPGLTQVWAAGVLWRLDGPAAAGVLCEALERYVTDAQCLHDVMPVLAAMGPHARPLLDPLDRWIATPRRAGLYLGDSDREMREDEQLLAAALDARARIVEPSS